MTDIFDRLAEALKGRYTLDRQVGEGGMATVYLAQDKRHDRKVALKVLRPELAAIVGAERFLQEIKTTANLQHPHILPLFDSGEADGFLYYVMPFVDGETLRDKLDRETQLGMEEAVRIAVDVAEALDYAHRQGVIHRDVKPANILLHEGRPMVSDFGVALAVSSAAGQRLTETGLSVGTPHYMSPEQAAAEKELTHRSDLYSLAAVLYEMVAGEPPHTGATVQAIIMKIVADQPRNLAELRKATPPHVAAATAKALEKLPADRFVSAGEFVAALKDPNIMGQATIRGAASAGSSVPTLAPRRPRWLAAVSAATVAAAGAVVGWYLRPMADPPPAPITRFTIPVPQGHEMSEAPNFGLSPDGRILAYFIGDTLFKRSLEKPAAEPLGTVPGGCCPIFTDDGRWIYSRRTAPGDERGISIDGGPLVDLTAHLRRQDQLVGSALGRGILLRRAGDSLWEVITAVDSAGREGAHRFPQLLPGGEHVLYTILGPSLMWHGAKVVAQRIGDSTRTTIAEGGTFGRYIETGHVVYVDAAGTFQGVPFDLDQMRVTGPPFVIESGIRTAYWGGAASVAISGTGTLAFIRGSGFENHKLTWVDREGTVIGSVGRPATMEGVQLSPDGRYAATYVASNNSDISIFDVVTGEERRLTFGEETEDNPVWSPDGRRIAYHQIVSGREKRIYVRDASGRSEPELLYAGGGYPAPRSWSANGDALAIFEGDLLMVLNLDDQSIDTVTTHAVTEGGRFSPDGEWLAYVSDETGQLEVYVVSYPGLTGRQQVSSDGGRFPQWSGESGELFFVKGDTMMASDVTTVGSFTYSAPRPLFVWGGFSRMIIGYGVSPDGQRFLFTGQNPDAPAREINVVLNWFQELLARPDGRGD